MENMSLLSIFKFIGVFLLSETLAIQVSSRGESKSSSTDEFSENFGAVSRQYYYIPQQQQQQLQLQQQQQQPSSLYYPGVQYLPGSINAQNNQLSPSYQYQYPQYQYQYPSYTQNSFGNYPGNSQFFPVSSQQQYPGSNVIFPDGTGSLTGSPISSGSYQYQTFPNQGIFNQGFPSQSQQGFYRPQNGALTTVPIYPTIAPILTSTSAARPGLTTQFPGAGFVRPGSASIFPGSSSDFGSQSGPFSGFPQG